MIKLIDLRKVPMALQQKFTLVFTVRALRPSPPTRLALESKDHSVGDANRPSSILCTEQDGRAIGESTRTPLVTPNQLCFYVEASAITRILTAEVMW